MQRKSRVALVLQNDDLVKLHDLHGGQVLTSLRLWARLVACYEQKGAVHDGGTGKHGSHEDIVTRAVDEGYMSP